MMVVSDRAVAELRKIVDEQGQEDAAVRLFVQGACGCGSAHYGMGLETEFGEDESFVEAGGLRFVMDPDSAPYLEGAEIDYQDGLMQHGFMIKNPTRGGGGCGCGH